MKEKKKAASTTANLQHRSGNKDSKSSRIKPLLAEMIAGKSYPTLEKKAGTLKTFVWTIEENYIG